jgi:hypothetical protein
MTRPIDPEIKAFRAMQRALAPLDAGTQLRVLNYWLRRVTEAALAAADIAAHAEPQP